jgi:hypothetical protein
MIKKLNEQVKAQASPNKNVIINGQEYKLEVKKGFGWMGVNVDKLVPTKDGWQVTASKLGMSQTDVVPQDTINLVAKNIGQPMIELGGKTPKRLVKVNENKVVKFTKKDLNNIVSKVLKEQKENYMFFSNLIQIRRQCDMMLKMSHEQIDRIIQDGHDWADDHVSEAKTNLDQVFDFFMNETRKRESYAEFEELSEGKKKTGTKLCARGYSAAKAKFKVFPSAYSSGYGVQVCKGKIKGLDGKKQCSGAYC